MGKFEGFKPEAFDLLVQLRLHNSKEYYEQHKPDYQQLLLTPFQQLIVDLSPMLADIEPRFQLMPSVGKCISRMRRDTRFTKDKSMYRDTMWFFIRKLSEGWLQGTGFYFELSPVTFRYGCGYFSASPGEMAVYREKIAENPSRFSRIVNPIMKQEHFAVEGEMYKRDMGEGKIPEKLYDWYNRKNIYLSHNSGDMQRIQRPEFSDELAGHFSDTAKFYAFLSNVCDEYHAKSGV